MIAGRLTPARGLVAACAILLLLFPLIDANEADQSVMILALVLAVGAVAVNIMSGYAGYHSFGEAVPFGIGAYAVAILSDTTGASPFLFLPAAAVAAAIYALFVGWIAVRGRGHTFVILTLIAMLLVQFVAIQWKALTGGPIGHPVPAPTWSVDIQNWPFHYALVAALGLALLISWRIRRAKLGMGLLALREDEGKAATIGVATRVYKVVGFCLSAAILGVVGGIYAYYAGYINPTDTFSIIFAAQLLLACLLGGSGTLYGPVIGAFILQLLDYYGNQTFGGGNARLFIVGGLLVIVVLFLPSGLLPSAQRWLDGRRARGRAALVGKRLDATAAASGTDAGAPVAEDAVTAPGEASEPLAPALAIDAVEVAPDAPPLLAVRDLRKAFGGLRAVDGCSFEVARGSVTALIGPNGSGKTTTFNLIGGTMRADAGEVLLDGERIDARAPWERAYRGLGRTFQVTRLFLGLTVLENVVAPLRGFAWHRLNANAASGEEAARAEELLRYVGMSQYRDQQAGALSYGQRKLVELAQVLMLEPRLILLDEPAGGINPRLIERMGELIEDLNRRGTTFLIVEHNMSFVLDVSDTVHVLVQGSCIRSGEPGEIQRDPLVREAYLGDDFAIEEEAHA